MTFRAIPLTIAAGITALALAGCSGLYAVPTQADYPRWADSQAQLAGDESAQLPKPPGFVPHDATDLYVRTLSSGAAIITYTSGQSPDASLCKPAELSGHPSLDANWWPVGKPPAEGMLCSPGWRVFDDNGVTYAWRS
jgi:hypothetical protein